MARLAPPSPLIDDPARRAWPCRAAWATLVALALWLALLGVAARTDGRLPLASEGVRLLREWGLASADVRRLGYALTILVALSHTSVGLLLVACVTTARARGAGLALLVLVGALLASGYIVPPLVGGGLVLLATGMLAGLVRGEAAARGVRWSLVAGAAGLGLATGMVLAIPALQPPRTSGLATAFASPLALLVWLPLPLALAHALWRGGLWGLAPMRLRGATLRRLAIGVGAGAGAGMVALGAGSRLAMRAVALLAGIPPSFTVEGTAGLIVMGAMLGVPLGAGYALLRDALPGQGRWRGLGYGVPLALLVSVLLLFAPNEGELALISRPIAVALFGLLPMAYALLLAPIHELLLTRLPEATRERLGWLGGYTLLATLGLLALLDFVAGPLLDVAQDVLRRL